VGFEQLPVIASVVGLVIRAFRFIFGRKAGPSVIQHVEVKESFLFQGPVTVVIGPNYVDGLPESPIEAVKRLFEEGVSRRLQGRYEDAVSLFRTALTLDVSREEKAALLLLIGACFFEKGQFEEAQGHYREAERIAEADNIYQGLAVARVRLGMVALIRDDIDSAIQYKDEALNAVSKIMYEDPGMWALQAGAHNLAGLIYQAKGESENACENYRIALDFAKRTGEPLMEVDALFGLAVIAYQTRGEWGYAADQLNKILPIVRNIGWYFPEGCILLTLADIYEHKGERDKALDLLYEALSVFVEVANREMTNLVIERIAYVLGREGRANNEPL